MSRGTMRRLSELHDVDAELIVIALRTHRDVVGFDRLADHTSPSAIRTCFANALNPCGRTRRRARICLICLTEHE
jgi:hypothetical protein